MRIARLAICMLSVMITSGAAGTDRFPFTEGVIYEYERIPQSLGRYIAYFSGTADVEGTTTHVRRFSDGLQQFWSETPEGDKRLHGFRIDAYSVHWLPPIVTIDEPLFVGKIWGVDSRGSDPDTFTVHIRYQVTALGDVTVPAGTFQAFTIRETLEFPEGGAEDRIHRHLRGIRGLPGTAQQVTDYSYADGIGEVLTTTGSFGHRLLSLRTVAVQPATWTRIRMLYR